jgi:hypothetical protein
MFFIKCLVDGKIEILAKIDIDSLFDFMSKKLIDELDVPYRETCDYVKSLFKNAIGEKGCISTALYYKGEYRHLCYSDAYEFIILDSDKPPYGPKYDLVLGQGWLWAHRAKIDMYRGNLIIDNCRIPLISEEKNIGFSDASSESESESESEPNTP